MIQQLRSFLAVIEEGSLHRAAARLRVAQSTLSRQIQALEHELGGTLLERTSTGVRPTKAGQVMASHVAELLAKFEAAMMATRRQLRGDSGYLRIGYVASAAPDFLEPALKKLRASHPKAKVKMFDLSPGEQIIALREDKIDVALLDQGDKLLSRDFYVRRIATLSCLIGLPISHPLADQKSVRMADLKDETFVSGSDTDNPGYNRRVMRICRACGKFRPKFICEPDSLDEGLAMVGNEDAVVLLPGYVRHRATPGVVLRPVADPGATWELFVAWRRSHKSGPLHALVEAFFS
ncbi:MAG: LysR family transcriptional regulator [Roseimicrobium sp.]